MNLRFKPPITGIVAGVGSLFGNVRQENKPAIGTGDDGQPIFKDDIIKRVTDELSRRKSERTVLEQQWTLNANFLAGNQFCDINLNNNDIAQIEPVYDWLEREAFNQIAPLIETRVANLKKISYAMKVKPATNELDDYAKAEVSTAILQYTQKNTDFESKKNTAIYWNEVCGSCFWLSWWDKNKGDKIGAELIESIDDGGEITHEEKVFFSGELDYGLITPYEVYPESVFKQTVEAQRSIIIEQVKTVDDVFDLYGVKVEGGSVETFELTPVVSGGGFGYENTAMSLGHHTRENAVKVITYFERPSRQKPQGEMIIIAGEDNLVYYGAMPYSRIPLVQMICREVPGQFFGKSAIEDLIPRQRAYNGCINRIHEYIKRISLGSYFVPKGSMDVDDFEERGCAPGSLIEYDPEYSPPVPIQMGVLPSEIMTERYNLKSDMEYVAGTSQLMVNGATPSGVTSGTAISNLMEIDNTRLSLTGENIRGSVRKLAIVWLEIYKAYASTRRVINYVGANNIGKAIVWSNEDINSYDVDYIAENELLMSEDAQKQRFFEAYNMGLFTDSEGRIPERVKQRALEFMRVGNYSEIMNINLLQMQTAQRENVFFENGVIPEVSEFDEHDIHIDEHLRYALQMDFQLLKMNKPEYAKALEAHIAAHKDAASRKEQQNVMQMPAAQQRGEN